MHDEELLRREAEMLEAHDADLVRFREARQSLARALYDAFCRPLERALCWLDDRLKK